MIWRYVLHYPFPLDEDAMRDAAARFVGTHDFASFAASTGSEEDDKERATEREIFSSELVRTANNEELIFTVRGRSFLRYMVRKMVGTLCTNCGTAPNPAPPYLPTASLWSKSSTKRRGTSERAAPFDRPAARLYFRSVFIRHGQKLLRPAGLANILS